MSWYNQGYQDGSRAGDPERHRRLSEDLREYGLKVDEASGSAVGLRQGAGALLHPLSLPTARDGEGSTWGLPQRHQLPHPVRARPAKGVSCWSSASANCNRSWSAPSGASTSWISRSGESDSRQRDYYRAQRERAIRHYEGVRGTTTGCASRIGDPVLLRADRKKCTWPFLFMPQTVFPSGGQDPALQRQGDAILVVIRGDLVCMGLIWGAALPMAAASPPARTC